MILPGTKKKPKVLYDKKNQCYYDFSTRNKSFVQLAKDLHTLKIKDSNFHLTLYDPQLIGVDPYDKNLTMEQVKRILNECGRNPWYFLREVVRIPEEGGDEAGVPYRANRGNIAQAWCIVHGIDSWLCLPRQQGKTVSALCLQAWMYVIGTTNSTFIFVNKDGDNAKKNLKKLSDIVSRLPVYLRSKDVRDEETGKNLRGKDNATEMYNININNTILTRGQANSKEKAVSIGRGLTAPIIHYDEPAFTPYIKEIIANSASTQDTAARNARRNGGMYARIFTCTPGDLDTAPGRDEEWFLERTAKWSDTFYDLGPAYVQKAFDHVEECNKTVYIEFSYKQIGLDEEWLKDMSAKIGDPLTVRRELLLQRLHGSSLSPFSQEDIEAINDLRRNPIRELWVGDWRFYLYEELDLRIPYLVGVDCATGTAGDNNAITIINPYTLKPVAEFSSKYIGEPQYVRLITELVQRYIPRACVCIERNHVGDAIIAFLLETSIAGNIYYDADKDLLENNLDKREKNVSMLTRNALTKKCYGVFTSVATRAQMFDILSDRVTNNKEDFVTQNITKDISNLVRTKSGKVEAGAGEHDDSVMSYLIAMYVWTYGNNLARFGINRKLRMGSNTPVEEDSRTIRSSSLNPDLVNENVIEMVKQQERAAENDAKNSYESMLRAAIAHSQRHSRILKDRLGVTGSVYDNTDYEGVYGEYYNSGPVGISDDFFDEINGTGSYDENDFSPDSDIFDF